VKQLHVEEESSPVFLLRPNQQRISSECICRLLLQATTHKKRSIEKGTLVSDRYLVGRERIPELCGPSDGVLNGGGVLPAEEIDVELGGREESWSWGLLRSVAAPVDSIVFKAIRRGVTIHPLLTF
jgi:hypothetical protein